MRSESFFFLASKQTRDLDFMKIRAIINNSRSSVPEQKDDRSDGDSFVTPNEDVFNLQNADHPGMVLVSVPLAENNLLPWSKVVKIALGAKAKLGFIDGTIDPPSQNSTLYAGWRKVDYMVLS